MSAAFLDTPAGRIRIAAAEGAIAGVTWSDSAPDGEAPDPLAEEAARQIAAWFDCRLERFTLPLAPAGTAFQQRAREAMTAIPCGETRTYAEVAVAIGSAARAVGQACARNPLPILVPCHRVTASDGSLGGWSGGAGAKRALLALEARRRSSPTPSPASPSQGGQ